MSSLRPKRTLFSKKYGVDLIRYTHGDTQTVVYSSNKLDGESPVLTHSAAYSNEAGNRLQIQVVIVLRNKMGFFFVCVL